ncbi:MAG: 30S ribosomal protein S20 [Phycisphaeraceae bacterium]|jgi:small subunit ribosomal protein S20|nr:30S ribosomal protein S20 [Phycisphaeraceae bacterium]
MAHSLSAKKRVRQNLKARARNKWRLKAMRTAVKELMDKLAHASLADAEAAFKAVSKTIDRTAAKGVIHKNQAARRKSRLAARIKARKAAGQVDAPPAKRSGADKAAAKK